MSEGRRAGPEPPPGRRRCQRRRSRGARARRGRRGSASQAVRRPSRSRTPCSASASSEATVASSVSSSARCCGREPLERVARGDDQLKAAADDVVEPALATGAGHHALNAEGSRQRIRAGGVEQARGERRQLERGRRPCLAQRRVALRGGLGVELAQHLAQLDGQPDDRLVLGLALGVDRCPAAGRRPGRAAPGRASTPGSPRRASRSTGPGRGTAASGGRRRRPGERGPGASGRRASSGTRRRCCGSAGRLPAGTTAQAATTPGRGPRSPPAARPGSSMNSHRR